MTDTNFQWTDKEKSAVTNDEQLAMFNRLVDFVNARLAEIKSLQTEMTDVKSDVEEIKNPNNSTLSK